MKDYKYHKGIGPGGINCICCQPVPTNSKRRASLKKIKQFLNRTFRRTKGKIIETD